MTRCIGCRRWFHTRRAREAHERSVLGVTLAELHEVVRGELYP